MMIIVVATILLLGYFIIAYGEEYYDYVKMVWHSDGAITAQDLIKNYVQSPKDYVIKNDSILYKKEIKYSFYSFKEYVIFFNWYRGRIE